MRMFQGSGERVQIATPLHCLAVQIPVSSVRPSLFFRELVLADTTERTYEILWEILKRCAWLYACLWHSYLWVILPAAYVAYILFHNCCCFNGLLIVMNIPFACHAERCQGRVISGGYFSVCRVVRASTSANGGVGAIARRPSL